MSVTLGGDDVQGFDTKLDEVHLSMGDTPKDDMLESMCNQKTQGFGTIEDHICSVQSRHCTEERNSKLHTLGEDGQKVHGSSTEGSKF